MYKRQADRCSNIDNSEGRQRVIVELYDKLFRSACPKTVERLGIVYTPVQIVDFILQSVADVLEKEFGRNISDENVHILDPDVYKRQASSRASILCCNFRSSALATRQRSL